jgi:hypothetical protein
VLNVEQKLMSHDCQHASVWEVGLRHFNHNSGSAGNWTWEISTHLAAASNTLHQLYIMRYCNIYIKKKVQLIRI